MMSYPFECRFGCSRRFPTKAIRDAHENYMHGHVWRVVPTITSDDDIDVTNLSHWTACKIQVIDFLQANNTREEFTGFLKDNVIKYVMRYQRKNGQEDLKKAMVYLKWLEEHEYCGGIIHER
jgi:hypothetical protein